MSRSSCLARALRSSWCRSQRSVCRTVSSSTLSSRLITLQDRWQQLTHIQTDLLETGFTPEAVTRSAIPEKHRLLHGSYTALLKSVIEDNRSRETDVIFVFDSICARYRPSNDDFVLMIRWFRGRRDPENAIKILQTMVHAGWTLKSAACNQVIDIVATESGSQAAQQLLDRLISLGFRPDLYTYASMINAAAFQRNSQLAEYWFGEYRKHDETKDNIVVYGALMKAYLRAGDFDKCLAVLDGDYSVQPNVIMFTTAIDACQRLKQVDRCFALFATMIARGISPTVRTYNHVINAAASIGDVESSLRFYTDLKSRGLAPDIFTFTSMLKGHLIDQESGRKITCTTATQHRSNLANVARAIFAEATIQYGIAPDLAMYTTMVNIYTLTGHATDALLCAVDMMASGIQPDVRLFGAILSCLSHHGSYHQCRNLYSSMIRAGLAPNVYCYQSIISSLRNHPARALDSLYFLEEMRSRDIVPDVKLYCTVMQVLGRSNLPESCAKVFVKARRHHPEFSHQDWCAVLNAAVKFSPNFAAKSLFWQHVHPALTQAQRESTVSLSMHENKR